MGLLWGCGGGGIVHLRGGGDGVVVGLQALVIRIGDGSGGLVEAGEGGLYQVSYCDCRRRTL